VKFYSIIHTVYTLIYLVVETMNRKLQKYIKLNSQKIIIQLETI